MGPQNMDVQQLAVYLQCHPSTIYRLLRKKQIPAWKLGSNWRFNVESIERWRKEAEQPLSVSVG